MVKKTLVLVSMLAVACGGKTTGPTGPGKSGVVTTRKAGTVKGRVARGGKKKVTHVIAIPKAKKGAKAPRPIRVPVRADGSYDLDIYYGYTWTIAYEDHGRKVGVASFKQKGGGSPSYSFNLTDNTTIINQTFDLGVYVESNSYYFEVEHAPWEYYDTDGDGQSDWDDLDDDNDGTADLADLDDDGDGFADLDEDFDADNDGELDWFDADDDNDGTPDEQDGDDDGDGVADADDGDDDYGDADHDGVADEYDADDDNDGIPDAQDQDDDGDGVADAQDQDDASGDDGAPEPMTDDGAADDGNDG